MTLRYKNKPVTNLSDLPDHIQDLLWDPRKVTLVVSLEKRLSLNDQQSEALTDVIDNLILGNIARNRVRFELQQRLAVPEGTAVTIADEVQQKLAEMETTPTPLNSEEQTTASPLPTIEIKPGAPTEPPPARSTPPAAPTRSKQPAPSLESLANAMRKPSTPKPVEKKARPSVPLPEDVLLKSTTTTEQPATSMQQATPTQTPSPIKPPSPSGKHIDSYREPIEPSDTTPNQPAPTPIPQRSKEDHQNLGPLIDGNIIDLRE